MKGFLEDLYECLSLKDVASLFGFLEEFITKLSKPVQFFLFLYFLLIYNKRMLPLYCEFATVY